jgi:hypothetical protein
VRAARPSFLIALLAFAACGPMLSGGGNPPPKPSHFRVHVYNQDVAAAETASLCWWMGSAFVGSRDVLVPPSGRATFDLGTIRPDGLQLVMGTARATNGILQGPGGLVVQSPDYSATWDLDLGYPWGQVWTGPP